MSGKWILFEGHPYWEWTYSNQWREVISAPDMVMSSTFHSDRNKYMVECYLKINQVYDHFNVPRLTDEEITQKLDSQLMIWVTWLGMSLQQMCPLAIRTILGVPGCAL